ncbi:MAG: PucR family transcriptional regulator ligand-binding domain-containing protein [Bacillota bacterium]|nr:PucR family transcriptional regulator ligand-binding domain-containing protein [Bacillota bacterium]MDI7249158.1 PucR family transcriptional regulator ligand-binding domain-containing protein [Bacillota bacterium]
MYITVREALQIGPLREASVIAGARGLDRQIRSVTVMDTPEIELWVRGGELLLTNAYVVKDEQARLISTLERVHARGVAAVGIKVRDFLENVVPQLIRVCERLDLPLLQVPVRYPWVEIINSLLGEIINRQVRVLEYALEVHERLSNAVLEGGGLQQVAEQIAELTSSPVSILDANWEPLVSVRGEPPAPEVLDGLRREMAGKSGPSGEGAGQRGVRQRLAVIEVPGRPGNAVAVVRMAAGREVYGYVVVSGLTRPLGDFEAVGVEQGAIAAAFEILRDRTARAVERRFRDTFLFDLLSGNIGDRDLAAARARALGWNLAGPYVVAVISLDDPGVWPRRDGLEAGRLVRQAVVSALGLQAGVVWLERTDGVVVCVPMRANSNNRTLRLLGEKLKRAADQSHPGCSVTLALGRVHEDIMGLAVSYREAKQALDLGRRLWGGNRVILYDELGFYRVLSQYPLDSEEMRQFCQDTLGPVVEYDRRTRSDLLKTLEVYLDCMGSWNRAAEVLCVHPNTLGYRLNRIQELLGVDLNSPEQRLHLQLALKILRIGEGAGLS